MSSIRARAVCVIASRLHAEHGLLPAILLVLTCVIGLADAVGFLKLSHVFVANMTGNVVFFALAISDPEEFSVLASALSINVFLAGALAGGRLGSSGGGVHRARLLAVAAVAEIVRVALAYIAATTASSRDTRDPFGAVVLAKCLKAAG
jgi:uncharacterized membrane protein YoaK (UPF0700 family)